MKAGRRARSQDGYSLLEALAAVFVVALASSMVVAAIPAPVDDREQLALAFAAKLDRARDQAVVGGVYVGVRIDESGCSFFERRSGEWIAAKSARAFGSLEWPAEAIVETHFEGALPDPSRLADLTERERQAAGPTLRFDPSGSVTAATVRFVYPDGTYAVRVEVDGSVIVEIGDD